MAAARLRTLLVLFPVLAVILSLAPATSAHAVTGASVSGKVTGPGGALLVGVDGIEVSLEAKSDGEWDGFHSTWLESGESSFAFDGLGPGQYRVLAWTEDGNYQRTYSAEFTLLEGQVRTGVDVALKTAASVSGNVTGPGGGALTGIEGVEVSVEERVSEDEGGWGWVRDVWLDPGESQYVVAGLREGEYRVRARPFGGNYVTTVSTPFMLADGQVRTGVNLTLPVGSRVTGNVTGPTGTPLSGVDGVEISVERHLGAGAEFEWETADSTWLDPGESSYSVAGLAPGEYRVRAHAEGGNHLTTYSAVFALAAGQTRSGVNLVLQPGAQVSGLVTGPSGAVLSGVDRVQVSVAQRVTRDGQVEWDWIKSSAIAPGSMYTLGGLDAGTYRIEAEAHDEDGEPVSRYLSAQSAEFTLSAGQTRAGLNIALRASASVSGVVTGPGGAALVGSERLDVRLEKRTDDGYWSDDGEFHEWDTVDGTAFSFGRLSPGTYRVRARAGGNYATTYSSAFTLVEGQSRGGVTVALEPGASVSGTITGPNGTPVPEIDGMSIAVQLLDHSLWDESDEDSRKWVASDFRGSAPESGGSFRVEGLAAGNYILSVKGDGFGDHYSQPFTVTAGQNLTGFGVELESPGSVSTKIVPDASAGYCEVFLERRVTIGGQTRWLNQNDVPWDGDWGYAWSGRCASSIELSRLSSGTYRLSALHVGPNVVGATYFTLGTAEAKSVEIELGKDDLGVGLPTPMSIVNVAPPVVSGQLAVGSVLSATPGSWTPTDAAVTFQWYRGGASIAGATGQSYGITKADVGRRLSVTATASKAGYAAGTASSVETAAVPAVLVPPAPPKPAVKQAAIIAVKAKAGKRKATITVRIAARGVPSAQIGGRAAVYLKGRKLRTAAVRNGRAVLKISKQRKGKRLYTVRYLGSPKVNTGSRSIRIAIR